MATADHRNPLLIPTLQEVLSGIDNLLQCIEKEWTEDAETAIQIIQNDLLQLTDGERATYVGSIRQHLSGKEYGDRACAMLNIELPDRPINIVFALDSLLQTVIDAPEEARLEGLKRLIAALATQDPVTVEHYAQQAKKANLMSLVPFRKAVNESARALPKNDEPTDKPSTWPYRVEHGRICYLYYRSGPEGTKLESNPVADFTARITEEITDEDGTRTFRIEGRAIRGGVFLFEMKAEDFGSDYRLKATIDAASGARDPVRAGMGKHLSPALQLLTGREMKQLKRYQRTGWADGIFLIPGRKLKSTVIELKRKLPYRISPDADLALGKEALEALILSMGADRSTVILATFFQAPLARLAEWSNERYALFISGRTGSLKTSFAQVAMCIYGAGFIDDTTLIKWGEGSTRTAVMLHAVMAHDMPFLIDNYKPNTGKGTSDFVNLIHNIVEGGDKDRANRNAQLRDTKPIYCWPVCTGEDVPGRDPSSLARILVVPVKWQRGEDNEELSKAQRLSMHLSSIGESWLNWLECEDGQIAAQEAHDKFEGYRSAWAKRLRKIRSDTANILRVASNLATNQLTWEVLTKHPELGTIARKYQDKHRAGLKDLVAVTMAEVTAEALEATRYISALRELYMTGRILVLPRIKPPLQTETETLELERQKDRIVGWQDDDGVYLLPNISRQAVERLLGLDSLCGISNVSLFKQLDELGFFVTKSRQRLDKSLRIRGQVKRIIHLKPDALTAEDDLPCDDSSEGQDEETNDAKLDRKMPF